MQITKCVIVDDEQPARELIQMHLKGMEGFELAGVFDNALTAFNFIQTNNIDLIFLDIQMPKFTGIQLIKSLKDCPKIIVTTAFREYAADAFDLDVLDYMVKPITHERFMKAISKYNSSKKSPIEASSNSNVFDEAYVFFKIGREQTKVFLKDILFIEGLKDYIRIHTVDKKLVAYGPLNYIEQKLPAGKFIRIHKSYIIAVDKISTYDSTQVIINGTPITIGRAYKKEVNKLLTK